MTHRTRHRIGTVVLASAAALSAWALTQLIGIDLVISTGDGIVGAADVVGAAAFGALAAWVVVWVLGRRSRKPQPLWAFTGSTALAVSFVGPAWFADGTSAMALMFLHIVTAVTVIVGFARTLPAHGDGRRVERRRPRPVIHRAR